MAVFPCQWASSWRSDSVRSREAYSPSSKTAFQTDNDRKEKCMNASSLPPRCVAALAIAVMLGFAGPVAAQSIQVYRNPLNATVPEYAKAPKRTKVHRKASVVNAAIVTESGPLKGIDVCG